MNRIILAMLPACHAQVGPARTDTTDSGLSTIDTSVLPDTGSPPTSTPETPFTVWRWVPDLADAMASYDRKLLFASGTARVSELVDDDITTIYEDPTPGGSAHYALTVAADGRLLAGTGTGIAELVTGFEPMELVAPGLDGGFTSGLVELSDGNFLLGRTASTEHIVLVGPDGGIIRSNDLVVPQSAPVEGDLWEVRFNEWSVAPDHRLTWKGDRILVTDRLYGLREVDLQTWNTVTVPVGTDAFTVLGAAVAADGTIYVAGAAGYSDWNEPALVPGPVCCVRRIRPDGAIDDLTQCEAGEYPGDGFPASEVSLGAYALNVHIIEPYLFISAGGTVTLGDAVIYRVRISD
jgi:hypothetical protein